MTHNICFILLAVDKENSNDPLKIWGLYLFVLAFPGECVNQLGSEVKSIPERSAGWFKTLDVWHRLMLCDTKKNIFLLIWSLELIKLYHKLLHNCHVSSWRPHHPDFEICDGSRLTQPLNIDKVLLVMDASRGHDYLLVKINAVKYLHTNNTGETYLCPLAIRMLIKCR